jgi:hypothetical protein
MSLTALLGGYDKNRLKSHLAMATHRFKLAHNKRQNEIKIERREVSTMVS